MHHLTEDGEFDGHSMIALYPDAALADKLAGLIVGGEASGELHVTVAYNGRTADVDSVAVREAVEAVRGRQPINAVINGLGRFAGATDDDPDAIVALVDSPDLERLRRDTLDALAGAGVDVVLNHGYTAHITLAYVPAGDDMPLQRIAPIATTFTTLTAKHGQERAEYSFDPAGESLALRAYVSGWAASGGPMTDRVKAGARAAVALAEADPDRPGVMEATLRLGHMEGTWAQIFDRRDQLHDRENARLLKLWQDVADQVDVDTLVDDAQDAVAGYDGSSEHRTALNAVVTGYLLGELRTLTGQAGWETLRQGVRDAIAGAYAEGVADALALSADGAGHTGFDWTAAHGDALAAIAGRDDLWADTDRALHQAVAATAAKAGRGLVGRAVGGDTTDQLTSWVRVDLADGSAFAVELRDAVDRAMAGAMWTLYQHAGLDKVNFVTVGDGQVCPACRDAEAKNPYSLFDVPVLPMHYGCRCTAESVELLPVALFIGYVTA